MSTLTEGFYSLFANTNKTKSKESQIGEGIVQKYDELTLDKPDSELIKLADEYTRVWNESKAKERISTQGEECRQYWVGRQYPETEYTKGKRPPIDNIIFEGFETFLPLVTQKNAQPVVTTDNSPEGQLLASKITMALSWLADITNLKMKIKKGVRMWGMYFVGVWKIAYDYEKNEIDIYVVKPKKLVLDPNGFTEEAKYIGQFIGELKEDTARVLIVKFPQKEKEITQICKGKLGTVISYTEWWTNDYVFWTLKDIVLHKSKNPHWNYDQQNDSVYEMGQPIQKVTPGRNHFLVREMPFAFLSVFSLDESPVDETTLIHQNLGGQDLINKRLKQIDKNADGTNAGAVVSGQYFNKDQAAKVGDALAMGKTVVVPTGDINQAYKRDIAPPLPSFVYQSLVDYRTRVLDRFGVRGSTPQGTEKEDTVRGKIVAANQDESRNGGGITDHIEQVAKRIYDWYLQMIYVYYDTPHLISFMGKQSTFEYIQLQSSDLDRKVSITVEQGSLLPKNELVQRNEAMDLWTAGAIDPITLFERLHFPNPKETAMKLFLWKANPMALFTGQPGAEQAVGAGQRNDVDANAEPPVEQPSGSEPVAQESKQIIQQVPIH